MKKDRKKHPKRKKVNWSRDQDGGVDIVILPEGVRRCVVTLERAHALKWKAGIDRKEMMCAFVVLANIRNCSELHIMTGEECVFKGEVGCVEGGEVGRNDVQATDD